MGNCQGILNNININNKNYFDAHASKINKILETNT